MRVLAVMFMMLSSPALSATCIPEPDVLTLAWVKECQRQFMNPLPTCYRLYDKPSDRGACLNVVQKIRDFCKTTDCTK